VILLALTVLDVRTVPLGYVLGPFSPMELASVAGGAAAAPQRDRDVSRAPDKRRGRQRRRLGDAEANKPSANLGSTLPSVQQRQVGSAVAKIPSVDLGSILPSVDLLPQSRRAEDAPRAVVLATRASRQPEGERVALCIVGEMRTLGMPLVHANLAEVAAHWRADTFLSIYSRHKHIGNAGSCNGRGHCATQCQRNGTGLELLLPLSVEHSHALPGCVSGGEVQFHHVGHCFVRAANYAHSWSLPPYDLYVRMRPDVIFEMPAAPPWGLLHGAGDRRPLVDLKHRDILFALTRTSLRDFLAGGRRAYSKCTASPRWLEHWDFLTQGARNVGVVGWDICYALVREAARIEPVCRNQTRGAALLNETLRRVAADPSLTRCAIELNS
jgi:hypothetical protein